MCSFVVECVFVASNFLTGQFKSFKLYWSFLLPDLSVTEWSVLKSPTIIDSWQWLFLILYILLCIFEAMLLIYTWIWNDHILQLNLFCFVETALFECTFLSLYVSHFLLFIIFFHPLLSTILYHCISVVFLANKNPVNNSCPVADIYSLCIYSHYWCIWFVSVI